MSAVTAVTQLVVREHQSRVRNLSEELLACFHDDATVETSWSHGNAAAFVSGAATRSASSGPIINRVGAPVVRIEGQRGFVELPRARPAAPGVGVAEICCRGWASARPVPTRA